VLEHKEGAGEEAPAEISGEMAQAFRAATPSFLSIYDGGLLNFIKPSPLCHQANQKERNGLSRSTLRNLDIKSVST
jgi:hypothetical protein